MFHFKGPIQTSKSWLNRALIINFFNKNLVIEGSSNAEDVQYLKNAITCIKEKNTFDLGLGGTSFRFFVFLISRQPGYWIVKAHERLLERPQEDLLNLMKQLGVKSYFVKNELHLESKGWSTPKKITCSVNFSSQFASGLLLSCWGLEFDMAVEINKPINSFGYLKMTFDLLQKSGMSFVIQETDSVLRCIIPKKQSASAISLQEELDLSSAFSLISAGVINGKIEIINWKSELEQPDLLFIDLFKKMNIDFNIKENTFLIEKQKCWKGIDCKLDGAPDLFPVLAVLCAFATGESILSGASQLVYKESNRIKKTHELLSLVGIKSDILIDGLKIYGQTNDDHLVSNFNNDPNLSKNNKIKFNPDHDHRMAMAAGLLILKGYNIELTEPGVVKKSYLNFWQDIGLKL